MKQVEKMETDSNIAGNNGNIKRPAARHTTRIPGKGH